MIPLKIPFHGTEESKRRVKLLVIKGEMRFTEDGKFTLTEKGAKNAMLNLLDYAGRIKYPEIIGYIPEPFFRDLIDDLIEQGLIVKIKENVRLSDEGIKKAILIMLDRVKT